MLTNKEVDNSFGHVGRPHFNAKAETINPIIPRTFAPGELEEIGADFDEHISNRRLIDRLMIKRQKLEDRLSDPKPTLAEQMTGPLPRTLTHSKHVYSIPAPPPTDLHFIRSGYLKRINEFKPMISATRLRLEPVFKRLNEYDEKEDLGIATDIPEESRRGLWEWWDRLQELDNNLDVEGRKFKAKEWRNLKGALKRIYKQPVDDSMTLYSICQMLTELNLTLP